MTGKPSCTVRGGGKAGNIRNCRLTYHHINANAYLGSDSKAIRELLKVEPAENSWADERACQAVDLLHTTDEKHIPALVYALFNDSSTESWSDSYRKEYPKHNVSAKLKGLYAWLTPLGYEMSEEEKTLLDGTHELFQLEREKSV